MDLITTATVYGIDSDQFKILDSLRINPETCFYHFDAHSIPFDSIPESITVPQLTFLPPV